MEASTPRTPVGSWERPPSGAGRAARVPGEAASEGSGAERPTSSSNPLAFPGLGAASHPPKKPHLLLLGRAGPQAGAGEGSLGAVDVPRLPRAPGGAGLGGGRGV